MDYMTWATQQFGPATVADATKQATVWGENADPDGDGLTNLMEYALGTDPQHFDPSPQADLQATMGTNPGHAQYDIRHRVNDPSLVVVPQVSTDQSMWWPELPTDPFHYTGDSIFFFKAQEDPPTSDGFQHDVFYHQLAVTEAKGLYVRLAVMHGGNLATTSTFTGVNVPPTVSAIGGSTTQSSSLLMTGYIGTVPVSVGGGASLVVNGNNVGSSANVAAGSVLSLVGSTPASGQTASYTLNLGSGFSTSWKVSTRSQTDPTPVSGTPSGYTPVNISVGSSGSANISLPITVPPGTGGMAPQLGLGYSSSGGNGLVGMGFSLSGLSSITRTGPVAYLDGIKGGVTFGANDRFLLDGQRLILASGTYGAVNSQYRTEMETFSQVTCLNDASGVPYFEVQSKAGLTLYFGANANSRVMANRTAGDTAVLLWGVSKIVDNAGNYVLFNYATPDGTESANLRIASITYTANDNAGLTAGSEVDFEYTSRPDIRTSYVAGVKIIVSKLLSAVQCSNGSNISRRYELSYQQAAVSNNSQLIQVLEKGAKPISGTWPAFPPTVFTWQQNSSPSMSLVNNTVATAFNQMGTSQSPPSLTVQGDFYGDGHMGLMNFDNHGGPSFWLAKGQADGTFTFKKGMGDFTVADAIDNSGNNTYSCIRTGDFNGDGKSDVVNITRNGTSNWVALSRGDGTFQVLRGQAQLGDLYGVVQSGDWTNQVFAMDINGDGITDIIVLYDTKAPVVLLGNGNGSFKKVNPGTAFNNIRVTDGRSTYEWVLPGDYNGDGLGDLFFMYYTGAHTMALSNGDGTFTVLNSSQLGGLSNKSFAISYSYMVSGDFNGDGLTDVANFDNNGHGWLALCKGDGTFDTVAMPASLQGLPASNSGPAYTHIMSGDFNGDGLSDLLQIYFPASQSSWLLMGAGDTSFNVALNGQIGVLNNLTYDTSPPSQIFIGDYDGDGMDDILHLRYNEGGSWLTRSNGNKQGLITQVTNGQGGYTKINYKPLSDASVYTKGADSVYPNVDIISTTQVVSSLVTRNGIDGDPVTVQQNPILGESDVIYSYERAWMCGDGHGFMGFKALQSLDSATNTVSRTEYNTTDPVLAGRPTLQQLTLITGELISQTTTTWTDNPINLANGSHTYFPYATQSACSEYEVNQPAGSAPVRTITVSNVLYDVFGNLTSSTTDYGNGFTEATISHYINDTTHWWLGRLTQTTVTQISPAGNSSRTATFAYSSVNGQLTRETIITNNNLALQKTYVHDGFGNITQSTQTDLGTNATRTTTTSYTPDGRFVSQIVNSLNQTETRTYDPLTGSVLSGTGPNGLTTTWTYDAFGRPNLQTRPDGTKTLTQYLLCTPTAGGAPPRSVHCIYSQSSGGGPGFIYFDVLDRQVRVDAPHFNGSTVSTYKAYDQRGVLTSASEPYYTSSGASVALHNDYQYDGVGREIRQTEPGNRVTSSAYNGLTATVTNPLSETFATVSDVRGRTTSATSFGNQTVTNIHDPYGNLIHADDGNGHTTTMTYDARGNRISMTEPNTGTTTYSYNAFGELTSQTDVLGRTIQFYYDALGRITQRVEPEGTTAWTYDTAPNGIGKVAGVKRVQDGYSEAYQYDSLGRLSLTTYKIGNSTYLTGTAYDEYGRVMETIYPTGFAILNTYTAQGFLNSVSDASSGLVYWTAVGVNERGQIALESFGNGLGTQRIFDSNTGLINTIQTGPLANGAVSPTVQNLGYTFNSIGNFTYRKDNNLNVWESFSYDSANRLQTITSNAAATINITYDNLGNIISRGDVGTYVYGSAAHPHAVTSIVNSPTGQNKNLYYDAAGNCLQDDGVDLSYNSRNQPVWLTDGGTNVYFNYDPAGKRYRQIRQSGTTQKVRVYIGSLYERYDDGTTITDTHYIPAASGVVAIKTLTQSAGSTISKVRYVHKDHLGSINALTTETGAIAETDYFDAWGRRRTVDSTTHQFTYYNPYGSQTTRGFTGHEMLDGIGLGNLIHMNGRLYDSFIGRFLSADPTIQDAENLQNLNRYSYVLNNPLSLTDPSGFSFLKTFFKELIAVVVTVAIAYFAPELLPEIGLTGWSATVATAAIAGFGGAFTGTLLSGGSLGDAFRAGLEAGAASGLTAGLAEAIGAGGVAPEAAKNASAATDPVQSIEKLAEKALGQVALHGFTGGVEAEIKGGGFIHGFVAGAEKSLVRDLETDAANFAISEAGEQLGVEKTSGWKVISKAISSGTMAAIGGKKFANAAITSGFASLFDTEILPSLGSSTSPPLLSVQANGDHLTLSFTANLTGNANSMTSNVAGDVLGGDFSGVSWFKKATLGFSFGLDGGFKPKLIDSMRVNYKTVEDQAGKQFPWAGKLINEYNGTKNELKNELKNDLNTLKSFVFP